jgi:N-acyl-D-aspartate/D-glutamate deacylase
VDVILRGGLVIDGTGSPGRPVDVGVESGKVVALGDLAGRPATETVDCAGRVVSPGFIDIHQHGDVTPLIDPRCTSAAEQGVTTAVIGNCGHGVAPRTDPELAPAAIIGYRRDWGLSMDWSSYQDYLDQLDRSGLGVNIAMLVPHGAVRLAAMGLAGRPAGEDELRAMEGLVAEAMAAGALGLSSGLEYAPGRAAGQAELTRLARVVGTGGVYASHIRNRAGQFAAAVSEALAIGAAGGCAVVLSHLAARPYAPAGAAGQVSALITGARERGMRVVTDTFPDEFGPSPLASVLPGWMVAGRPGEVTARLRQPEVAAQAVASFESGENFLVRAEGADSFMLTSSAAHPQARGHTIGELAGQWGVHPAQAVCRLLADEGDDYYSVIIQHRYASGAELDRLYRDPDCAFESDGVLTSQDGPVADVVMNRSTFGYTARVLGELVRERRLLSLPEAVRRMTSLPAQAVGLRQRGQIRLGWPADLVVFDPGTVTDNSTDRAPARAPSGIGPVLVNGMLTGPAAAGPGLADGRPGPSRPGPGRVLSPAG